MTVICYDSSRVFPGMCTKAHEGVFQGAPHGGAHTSSPKDLGCKQYNRHITILSSNPAVLSSNISVAGTKSDRSFELPPKAGPLYLWWAIGLHMCNKDMSEVRGRKFQNIRDAKRCLKLPNMIKDVRCIVLNLAI